jgi:hypothetical protein
MHGLPVRVVAVTNVDLKIMSRRTPTDRVLGRRRSPRASRSENASRYCRSGIARAATTAGADIRRRHRSCCRGDWVLRTVVDATNDWRNIVGRRTMTPRVPAPTMGSRDCNQEGTSMSALSKLHQRAAEHHEHAARHHREAAKLQEAKDILAAVDQAHLAHDHQVHAIRYAAEAAKEYASARRRS